MHSKLWFVPCLGLAMISWGCGPKVSGVDPPDGPKPKSMREKESEVTDSDIAEVMADGAKFDEEFADRVLKRGARKASECTSMNAPTGEGEVTVVFDGEKGRVVDVELSYLYEGAGDAAQKCIKNSFIGEMVPPFEGEQKKVPYTINIPEKGAEEGDKKE